MLNKTINHKNDKQQGFTLIELIVVMALVGILWSVFTPSVENQVKNQRISATINELDIIANAAQNYATLNQSNIETAGSSTYDFPGELKNQCQNAITVMSSASFIIGIGVKNNESMWFGEPFNTSCTTQTFSISIKTDQANAQRIKNTLGSVLVAGEVATYTVNKPSLVPIINDYIALLDDSWDAQSKTIANVADVSYTFGKKASQAVYDMGLVCNSKPPDYCDDNVSNKITKPDCPSDSTQTFLITGLSKWGSNDVLIDYWNYAVTNDNSDPFWLLQFTVGAALASSQTIWSYITKCE